MTRKWVVILLWTLGLLFAGAEGYAQTITLDARDGLSESVDLSRRVSVRCDPTRSLSVDEVASPSQADQFVPVAGRFSRGYTRAACWLRFGLRRTPDGPHDWFLKVGPPYLDNVTLFKSHATPAGGTTYSAHHMGDRHPFADRPIAHTNFVFPIYLPEGESTTFYLRMETSSTMLTNPLEVWQFSGLIQATETRSALYWFAFGLISLGGLIYLLFWVWLREKVYLGYFAYLLSLLLVNLSQTGLLGQYVFSDSPILADRLVGVLYGMALLAGLEFFNLILGLSQRFRPFRSLIYIVRLVYMAGIVSAAVGYHFYTAVPMQLTAFVVTVWIALVGPWLLWRGHRDLTLYVLAFMVQLITVIITYLRNLDVHVAETNLEYLLVTSTVIHVLLLSYALGDRLRRTQRQMVQAQTDLVKMSAENQMLQTQHQFVAMVTHEFRTPLAIIETSAQQITNNPDDAAATAGRCRNISQAVGRMTGLMDEFIHFDRIDEELRTFQPTQCDPQGMLASLANEYVDSKLRVTGSDLPPFIRADCPLLLIALRNLINNSLKHAGGDTAVELIVRRRVSGGVEFEVSDTGPGIPAEDLPYLFNKYYRGKNSLSRPGVGLGLYLVKRIAEIHGGDIHAESTVGSGCRFVLSLP